MPLRLGLGRSSPSLAKWFTNSAQRRQAVAGNGSPLGGDPQRGQRESCRCGQLRGHSDEVRGGLGEVRREVRVDPTFSLGLDPSA